ncbi:MAG TPA: hypothetical protein IAA54_10415 [Candidatus Gallacutalibacter pullicola]|uniref:Uncharacterized protein n=1 Tax=Candidatus Gallacutalibacter pullicola TaxID=2840830 RepID=A0A9D1J236_9FIRM|nr:hypothetical protein [Candidatus Gallacutalibacter pullicola]
MRLYHVKPYKLLSLLEHSTGNLFLVTDGVCFSLKSRLAQLYAVKHLMERSEDGTVSAEIRCDSPRDKDLFLRNLSEKELLDTPDRTPSQAC